MYVCIYVYYLYTFTIYAQGKQDICIYIYLLSMLSSVIVIKSQDR